MLQRGAKRVWHAYRRHRGARCSFEAALDELIPYDDSQRWRPEAAAVTARPSAPAEAEGSDADATLASLRRMIAAEKDRIFVDEHVLTIHGAFRF